MHLPIVSAERDTDWPQSGTTYPLRVAYDASALVRSDGGTGKGSQLRNILGNYIDSFAGLAPTNTCVSELPLIRKARTPNLLWQQSALTQLLFQLQPDVFLSPYNISPLIVPRHTRVVLILHDLILMKRFQGSSLRERLLNEYRRYLISPSVARSSVIITVSNYSRQEILRRFPHASVKVIPCTVAPSWFSPEAVVPLSDRRRYILMVTATPSHKNTGRALEAYAKYVQGSGPNAARLHLVGVSHAAKDFLQKARDLGVLDKVVIEPYLTEIALQDSYRFASAILVPSLMEGFGIPVLEGMASGTPVICSNVTSLPEVAGDAAVYCDPFSVDDIAKCLSAVLSEGGLRASMITRGLSRARLFHPTLVRRKADEFWAELPAFLQGMRT